MPSLQVASREFLDNAPFRVVCDVTVMAPIVDCWSLLVDQASWVQWFEGMSAVEAAPWFWTEPGQTRTVKINSLSIDETAVSVESMAEYAFAITKWPLPTAVRAMEGVRLKDRTNDGSPRTTLTYIGAFEPTTIGRWLEGVLEKQLTSTWRPSLKRLGILAKERAATRG